MGRRIELEQNDSVIVALYRNDGEFKITYGRSLLTVTTNISDDKGRNGIIYQKRFAWKDDVKEDNV